MSDEKLTDREMEGLRPAYEETSPLPHAKIWREARRARASEETKDAEIARLRAALKPFADLAGIYVRRAETFGWEDSDGTFGAADAEMDRTITVADHRAALKALGEEP